MWLSYSPRKAWGGLFGKFVWLLFVKSGVAYIFSRLPSFFCCRRTWLYLYFPVRPKQR